jgi:hypothetical protein
MQQHVIKWILVSLLCAVSTARAQPEVRYLPIIEPQHVLDKLGGPTLVSIHLKDATPQQFYEELEKQTGLNILSTYEYWKAQKPLVTLDVDQEPFWLVVHKFALQTGRGIAEQDPMLQDHLYAGEKAQGVDGFYSSTGPFFLTLAGISQQQTGESNEVYGHTKTSINAKQTLTLRLFSDPKVNCFTPSSAFVIEKVETDDGISLIDQEKEAIFGMREAHSTWVNIPLDKPGLYGKKIKILKGYCLINVVTAKKTWTIPDITKAQGATFGEIPHNVTMQDTLSRFIAQYKVNKVTLEKKPYNYRYVVQLYATHSTPPLFYVQSGSRMFTDIRVWGINGKERSTSNPDNTSNNDYSNDPNHILEHEQLDLELDVYQNNPGSHPRKMVWQVPTEFRRVKVPFVFHDIPLP